jgi:hypothetical protein
MPTTLELRSKINWLNGLDPKAADFEQLKRAYKYLITGYHVLVEMSPPTEMYFRARVNAPSKPARVSEIMAPPVESVTGFQRCNGPGVPMFYASSRRKIALLECEVSVGDTVYLGQWIPKMPLPINATIFATKDADHKLLKNLKQLFVQTYIETLFTRRVDSTFAADYKFPAALSEVLTTNFPVEPFNDIRNDRTVGLRYRSVVDIENSYNTAFHSLFAIERLEPLHVMEFVVTTIDGNQVSGEVSDNAVEFTDGHIHWLNDKARVPKLLASKASIPFIYDGQAYRLPTSDTVPTAHDISALMNE